MYNMSSTCACKCKYGCFSFYNIELLCSRFIMNLFHLSVVYEISSD
jgi:hypothetical protein